MVFRCPLCGKVGKEKYYIDRFEEDFWLYECEKCGIFYRVPFPKREEIIKFYDNEYYGGNKVGAYIDERKEFKYARYVYKARLKKIISYLGKDARYDKRFLDVGAGFGGLLMVAKEMGFSPYAVELSSFSANYIRENVTSMVYEGFVEDVELPQNFFSVISLIEVIEHLYNPKKALTRLYNSLKSGGVLVIQTADMDGLQARIYKDKYHYILPWHLVYFTKRALRKLLIDVGFSNVIFFRGVEFSVIYKLLRSVGSFRSIWDYRKWVRIVLYHLISKVGFRDFSLTSAMVAYAIK